MPVSLGGYRVPALRHSACVLLATCAGACGQSAPLITDLVPEAVDGMVAVVTRYARSRSDVAWLQDRGAHCVGVELESRTPPVRLDPDPGALREFADTLSPVYRWSTCWPSPRRRGVPVRDPAERLRLAIVIQLWTLSRREPDRYQVRAWWQVFSRGGCSQQSALVYLSRSAASWRVDSASVREICL
jgi:hypothetical protein